MHTAGTAATSVASEATACQWFPEVSADSPTARRGFGWTTLSRIGVGKVARIFSRSRGSRERCELVARDFLRQPRRKLAVAAAGVQLEDRPGAAQHLRGGGAVERADARLRRGGRGRRSGRRRTSPRRCSTPQILAPQVDPRRRRIAAARARMPGGTGRSTWPGKFISAKRPSSSSRTAVHDWPITR